MIPVAMVVLPTPLRTPGYDYGGRHRPLPPNSFWNSSIARYTDDRHSSLGMIRTMNSSNIGTVNPVSPWLGLQIMPLLMS